MKSPAMEFMMCECSKVYFSVLHGTEMHEIYESMFFNSDFEDSSVSLREIVNK